jgi:prevent-host-death family protein
MSHINQNFAELLQRASTEPEGIVIVQENRSFVLLELETLQALMETAELLQVPDLLADVAEARQEYQKGETLTMDQVFGDA